MTGAPELAFSHVGLFVHDIALMEDFYCRVMGFPVTDRGVLGDLQRLVFLSRDPREHHQIVLVSGRPLQVPFNVVNQISFRVAGLPAVREFHERLRGEAVTEVRPVTHGNAWSVYFRDPEGNRLEIFCDTPWYVSQPLREPIDFSQSDDEIYAATEARVRALPGFKTQAAWQREIARVMGVALDDSDLQADVERRDLS